MNPELREAPLAWTQGVRIGSHKSAEWELGHRHQLPMPGLCRDRSLTSFRTGPPAIPAFGLAASIGPTSLIQISVWRRRAAATSLSHQPRK